jgi:hypothetical protein
LNVCRTSSAAAIVSRFTKSAMRAIGAKSRETWRVQFSLFDGIPGFHHAVTTREHGVSEGAFDSLNLAFTSATTPIKCARTARFWRRGWASI